MVGFPDARHHFTRVAEQQVWYVHSIGSIIQRLLGRKIWKDESQCCLYGRQYQWFIVSEGGHLHGHKVNTLPLSICNFKLYEHNLTIMILLPSKLDNFEALFAPGPWGLFKILSHEVLCQGVYGVAAPAFYRCQFLFGVLESESWGHFRCNFHH